MKRALLLLGFGILAASMAFAQVTSGNNTAPGAQASPPAARQRQATQSPAAATTPNARSEVGTNLANSTGESESAADRQSSAAQEGQLNRNPQTGEVGGRGINNQGVNQPNAPNPNPRNGPSANWTPTSHTNQSKPLNQDRATNAPWTHPNADNVGTPPPPH